MTMPPVKYTGGPGIGGSKNINTPMLKNTTNTTHISCDFKYETNHAKKITAPLPTPMEIIK